MGNDYLENGNNNSNGPHSGEMVDLGSASHSEDEKEAGQNLLEKEPQKSSPGFLELIYGVLFDPVKTFQRAADDLPLGRTVLIFTLVKILSASMILWYTSDTLASELTSGGMPGLEANLVSEIIQIVIPVFIIMVLVYEYIKWFVYSGLLSLLADLMGGKGRAVGAMISTGLASLPSLLFVPFQIIAAAFGGKGLSDIVNFLVLVIVLIWGFILVVIGLRETQRLTTGSAVLVALIPALSFIVLFILLIILVITMMAPIISNFP